LFSTTAAPRPQTPAKVVSGQRIAKASASYLPWQRAEDAIRWMRGEVAVNPTAKLAAEVFGVSVPTVTAARKRLDHRDRAKRFNGGVSTLSDDAIERIVVEVGVDRVWRAVDKLTQPELPLVAAE
jgi:hypothetical protein